MYKRGRKVGTAIHLYEGQMEMLKKLSVKTGVPKAVYIREGIDLVLDKYRKELSLTKEKGDKHSTRHSRK